MVEIYYGRDILKKEYLNVYEGIQSEIVNTTRFDENSDLSTTYLRKSDRSKSDKLRPEKSFPHQSKGINRKIVRQNRMSITIRHRCKQIIYVKIILHAL